jgi:GFO/IDH/MocA oxidoreductase family protein
MSKPTRRAFLGAAGATVAAGVLRAADEPEPVRVAVIGTGARGSDLTRALTTIDGADVAGVCDDYAPHLEQGAKYAGPRAKSFADYKAMLDQLKPRAVVIAVPLALHYRVASDALAAGCDVFLEKTMCYSIDEARRLAKQAAESKRVFQVGLQRRANPIYKQAAAMVEAGLIGQVTAIKAQWHRNNSWRRPIPVPKTDPEWASLEKRLNWRLYKASSAGLMATSSTWPTGCWGRRRSACWRPAASTTGATAARSSTISSVSTSTKSLRPPMRRSRSRTRCA